jgi:hypothetical protein
MIARRTPSRQIRFNATNESLWISYQIGFPLCVDSTKRKLRPDFGARCSKLSKERGPETGSRLDRIRYRRHDGDVFMWAFLIELDGDDLRRGPLAVRKATLGSLLYSSGRSPDWISFRRAERARRSWALCDVASTGP